MENNSKKVENIKEYMMKAEAVMAVLLLCIVLLIACKMPEIMEKGETQTKEGTQEEKVKANGYTVIIDPGHGGIDPGKIGVNKVLEKEINLSIALKLKERLEEEGYKILMTRMEDTGLYSDSDSNKKRTDMNNRCSLINSEYAKDNTVINVSIHQNSYTSEGVKGPQVFYYSKSESGNMLAKILQDTLNESLQIEKPRVEKANDSYYMLVHTDCPSVIVECGFLSNWEESEKLKNETYQMELVEAILKGIGEYNNLS